MDEHKVEGGFTFVPPPDLSEWSCYLFGSTPGNGLVWRPNKGKTPNVWWRFWQRVFFGNTWVKDNEKS